jgi:DNA repair protein RadC
MENTTQLLGPREELCNRGAHLISDCDLLTIILSPGMKEHPAYVLARRVLKECRGLEGLKCKRPAELEAIPGVGRAKACRIVAAAELGRRLATCTKDSVPLSNPEEVARYAQKYATEGDEVFVAIGVNVKNRPIGEWAIARGWESGVNLTIRQIFTVLLKEGVSRVIFVHNHPSGDPTPSHDDIKFTEKILHGAQTVDIKVLDHVIVAQKGFASMRAMGYAQLAFAVF